MEKKKKKKKKETKKCCLVGGVWRTEGGRGEVTGMNKGQAELQHNSEVKGQSTPRTDGGVGRNTRLKLTLSK